MTRTSEHVRRMESIDPSPATCAIAVTVRMLTGILEPDEGSIAFGEAGGAAALPPASLGYLPEERGLYKEVSPLRTLVYFGVLRGMTRGGAREAALGWLDRLDLTDRKDEKLDALSKGNQQKVQFIAALLHRPSFAILDEPFSGLDPVNQDFFLDLIRERRERMIRSAQHPSPRETSPRRRRYRRPTAGPLRSHRRRCPR